MDGQHQKLGVLQGSLGRMGGGREVISGSVGREG